MTTTTPAPTPTRYVLVMHFGKAELPSGNFIEVLGTGHGCDKCSHLGSIATAVLRQAPSPVDASAVSAKILKFGSVEEAEAWLAANGANFHVSIYVD